MLKLFKTLSECSNYLLDWIKHVLCGFNTSRSSHRKCTLKKGALKNFLKFKGKHLWWSLFFNKVAGLSPGTGEFYEISKNTSFGGAPTVVAYGSTHIILMFHFYIP